MNKMPLPVVGLCAALMLLGGCSLPSSTGVHDRGASASIPGDIPLTGNLGTLVIADAEAPAKSVVVTSPAPVAVPGNSFPVAMPAAAPAPAHVVHGPVSPGGLAGVLAGGAMSSADAAYVVQKVYFGTDRLVTGPASAPVFSTTRADHLTYGEVHVSIPRNHKQGELESPSVWLLQFQADPGKHITLLRTATLAGDAFWSALRQNLHASPRRSVLVFVHGFNVSFDDAARRTAQMAFDLQFRGATIFFSWPSRGKLSQLAYSADEQAIIDAQPHLEQFLREVLAQSGADSVYLIAHSMGNRGLTRALASLAVSDPHSVGLIKEVILAAPDIGATEFTEQVAPGLLKLGAPVTLYASSHDKALVASNTWHNGARLGESAHLVVLKGMETIDASAAQSDLLGHSYYGQRTVLDDLFYLVDKDMRAPERCCLHEMPSGSQSYWVFMK
ncbi:alpha/beta hydrolase [Burkholderia ubonensis]|uniref:alpha/beta hydrolase n=1 Tax=Burkholderia ubonensis TaxID=101571 RepID=UPI000AC33514|nr:alpha/beta hydrolase [Burkholderia ubonensis]